MNSRDFRLIALAGAGLALVFVARGAEQGSSGDIAINDPSAKDVAEPNLSVGSASGADAIRLLNFDEIDQSGGTCDDAIAGTLPRTIRVSEGDGLDEAVVHTVCEYGANGAQDTIQVWGLETGSAEVRASLGEPPASVSGPLPSAVKDVAVDDDGTLAVTWTHYDEDDPQCCPGWESTVRYLVTGSKVTPVGDPVTRAITS